MMMVQKMVQPEMNEGLDFVPPLFAGALSQVLQALMSQLLQAVLSQDLQAVLFQYQSQNKEDSGGYL